MGLRATVLAAAAVTGCAAEGEGLVIRVEDPAGAVTGTITHLELFVGRTGPDERFVRDFDPMRDLYQVELESLDGYRLFLRADVVPTDLEAVAIVGYTADPATGAEPAVMALVLDPPFMPGELLEVPAPLQAVVPRTQVGTGARWAERRTSARIEPVADHSCLAWGTGGVVAPEGAIVRADDLDCDGTVPPACDPEQRDPLLLEGEADLDGDGFAEWTDALCSGACVRDGAPVRCDCDETSTSRHFGRPEVCDGVDNDCDPATHGDFTSITSLPCQTSTGGAECDMGVRTCTESSGLVQTPCAPLPASGVACLGFDGCQTPEKCPIGFASPGTTLSLWHCLQTRTVGGVVCGDAAVAQLFAQLPIVPPPARCSAALWGGSEPGSAWHFTLHDRTSMATGSVLVDVACDALDIRVEAMPATNGAETVVILVIGDGAGTPIAAVPLHYRAAVEDGCDGQAATVCTRS
jgi:hypothetical protein